MKTNGEGLEPLVDLEKERYDWEKDVIVNKSKLLEKIEDAEALGNIPHIKRHMFSIKSAALRKMPIVCRNK